MVEPHTLITLFHAGNPKDNLEPALFEFVGVLDINRIVSNHENGVSLVADFMTFGHPNGIKSIYKPAMVVGITPLIIAIFLQTKKANPQSSRKALFSDNDVIEYKAKFSVLEYKNEWFQLTNFDEVKETYLK